MYLGSEVTCPACQQKDATLRVSWLINQVKRELTPAQLDALTTAMQRGEAREWASPPKSGSWENLAKQLAPPNKPDTDRLSGAEVDRSSDYLLTSLGLGAGLFMMLGAGYIFGLAAFCLVGIIVLLAGIGVVFLNRNQREKVTRNHNSWSIGMEKWNRLFYCGRDEQVFAPGNPRHVAPQQIHELIGL